MALRCVVEKPGQMSALVSQGDILSLFKQDVFETWGSDCASLVAPLLGNDSAFDTATPLAVDATAGEGVASTAPSTSLGSHRYARAAGTWKRSQTAGIPLSSGAVPQLTNDNEAVLSSPRQRALQMLSRSTIYGARPVPECLGHPQPEPLCESVQNRQSVYGGDASSLRGHGMAHPAVSLVQSSGVSISELDLGTGATGDKALSKEFLSTPYDFSMSRSFRFSDGSKINVSLDRSL